MTLLLVILFQTPARCQDILVSGKVTGNDDGVLLQGVSVYVKGSTTGTITSAEGTYSISLVSGGTLVFSFVGFVTQEVVVNGQTVIDVVLETDLTQLSEVVVTALGITREVKDLPFASQQITEENLNVTQNVDMNAALAGKIAGVSMVGEAGSKLGFFGKIRIRGPISLTTDSGPLYVIDGVPVTDPNDVDMNNVESVNVLKGPNASALYGQRAEFGAVLITTKSGARAGDVGVEFQSGTTWDKVSYLPKYQNLYGGGYDGEASFGTFDFSSADYPDEWSVLDGKRYLLWDNNYADESWGPKFDGEDYVPWYAWWPNSPYYGQTEKYVAQPDNIKNFYQTGLTTKNTISVNGGRDHFNSRVSYTNQYQRGITPFTHLNKHYFLVNLSVSPTERLTIDTKMRLTTQFRNGDFYDGYQNQTTGTFNQWWNRNLDVSKLRELKDLTTFNGYSASWNWWGPDYYLFGGDFEKPTFWYNPYTYMEKYKDYDRRNSLTASVDVAYQIYSDVVIKLSATRFSKAFEYEWYFPDYLARSAAPDLYNPRLNSFSRSNSNSVESNYFVTINYSHAFGDLDVTAMAGGNIRDEEFSRLSTSMSSWGTTGGLIIPDVYQFSNASIVPVSTTYDYRKKVNSLYASLSLGFRDMVYMDATFRKDWSSALPADKNGYGYPSVGGSFIFSELLNNSRTLSFGKIRASWAQVGNDVGAYQINPVFTTGGKPFQDEKVVMYNPSQAVSPGLKPALNTSAELGFDVRFWRRRVGLSFTYFNETRKDEIIPLAVSSTTGYSNLLTNAGETRRQGVEVTLDANVFRAGHPVDWNIVFNLGTYNTVIKSLPGDLEAVSGLGSDLLGFVFVENRVGSQWGQLRGTAIARDENGSPIVLPNGQYKTVRNQNLGSVIPDFSGGVVNRLAFKGISLVFTVDFQHGGKFFSGSEQWGQYSGLLNETAALNDKGLNVRDDLAAGGGVHIVGVTEEGDPVDRYMEANPHFTQWLANTVAEPFIHDRSYVKLREVSLSYDLQKLLNVPHIRALSIGFVGRNLWLIAVAKNNVHRWDPSELGRIYGEAGQLPGTRSYGVYLNVSF